MEYSEQQKRAFREEFKRKRARQLYSATPVILIMIGIFVLRRGNHPQIMGVPAEIFLGGVVVLIAAIALFSMYNWRCPACGGYLGRGINPRFCAKCGLKLQ